MLSLPIKLGSCRVCSEVIGALLVGFGIVEAALGPAGGRSLESGEWGVRRFLIAAILRWTCADYVPLCFTLNSLRYLDMVLPGLLRSAPVITGISLKVLCDRAWNDGGPDCCSWMAGLDFDPFLANSWTLKEVKLLSVLIDGNEYFCRNGL
ncbi:hypothetical protein Nepgr_033638 [Nepenthes gracilis]|uniref:Uncharacterized protein n=1 Tax=Nepenthes gracilis TaxID=150966 RepID=A0AAD3TM70_NEPGR|nr:hypothetical protein Nepgr_033638 [Nepenthes gracilis]